MRPTFVTRLFVVLATVTLCTAGFVSSGCASGSKQAEDQEAEVGQPPAEGEADSEPRDVPKGPSVDISDDGESESDKQVEPAPSDAPTVTAAQIETFMEKGPPHALTVTRVEPHRINGAFAGFEIIAMHPDAKRFVQPQLAVGDVVTHINGVRMRKPDDYLAAWKLLDDVDAVRVKLMRDGEKREAVWRVVDGSGNASSSSESSE